MKEKINLFYTNDLHSYFEHWPHVVTFLKQRRREAERRGESSWTIDIGDHIDRVNPITEATMGKANVELLNEAGYDFATIGNNEGITLGHQELTDLYEDANFEVICSNLKSTISNQPEWLHTSKIITSRHGVKIGLFGLTARFNPYYHLLGWDAVEIKPVIEGVLEKLRNKADIIVLMSHLGINEDQMIARNYPEIDLIIGGHTHHLLRNGEQIGNTLLTAGGKHVQFAGEAAFIWDHDRNRLEHKSAHAIDITHLDKDRDTLKHLEQLTAKTANVLDKEIIKTKETIEVNWFKETAIMQHLTDKLLTWTKAEVAMLNAGLLLESLSKGVIKYRDVHRICPHPINPCVVTLSGEALFETVRASLTRNFMEFELKGFGFRGKVLGRMQFAGIEVITNTHNNQQLYVEEILMNGAPLEKDRNYYVATGDLFTFGNLLPQISRSPVKKLFLPEFIRDVLIATLQESQFNSCH